MIIPMLLWPSVGSVLNVVSPNGVVRGHITVKSVSADGTIEAEGGLPEGTSPKDMIQEVDYGFKNLKRSNIEVTKEA